MVMLAHELVEAGVVNNVLVVAGENRLTGQARDSAIQTLAQVGHPDFEVPLGPTIPAYYGLVASRYMHEFGITEEQLAEFAVLMRKHAVGHPGAQFREPITVADVMASRSIATPLKLLDCCPVSDGGAAFIISRERVNDFGIRIMGAGQAHRHQHVTMAGRRRALWRVGRLRAGDGRVRRRGLKDIDYVAIYDSFTITLAILLEEIGIARRGEAALDGEKRRVRREGETAAEHPWRAALLRALRHRRRDGACGGDASADDREGEAAAGARKPRWR